MIRAKAVIFDTDCTLVDTVERFFEVFNSMLEERGDQRLGWEDFYRRYVEDSLDDAIVTPKKGRKATLHRFWMDFLRKYREEDTNGKVYPGVKKLLGELHRRGVPIAVVTSCIVPPPKLREELAGLGIGAFVTTFATAHDVLDELEEGHHFSKVEIFRRAAESLGVKVEDCVVVGDYWNDIQAGKQVGAKAVGVLSGFMRRGMLESYGPDAIIDSTKDLLTVVEFETKRKKGDASEGTVP